MRVRCVGAVILDEDNRLLVVRRRNPPSAGAWSIPGGRVEPSESALDAVRREVLEETGLAVDVGGMLGIVDIADDDAPGTVFEVADYRCSVVGDPKPVAGDDATDARWVTGEEFAALNLVPGLADTLRSWNVLPG